MLEILNEVSVHSACYKNYANKRLASIASHLTTSVMEETAEPKELRDPLFCFKKNCLFCGEVINESLHVPVSKREKFHSITRQSVKENIHRHLQERDDEFARKILERVHSVQNLVAVGARYHGTCASRVYNTTPKGTKKGRPYGNKVDEAMGAIYSYLEENSSECQFSMSELVAKVEGNFVPDVKTIKNQLKKRYGGDILIIEKRRRGCIVCFRNIGYEILSEKWYDGRL